MKDNTNQHPSNGKDEGKLLGVDTTPAVPHGSGTGGGTRAGLFRTPISGGVQSATSAHGLPPPALAVRNLMEQVSGFYVFLCIYISISWYYSLK